VFEKIECEWPLFFCYLILDYCFQNDTVTANFYVDALEKVNKKKSVHNNNLNLVHVNIVY